MHSTPCSPGYTCVNSLLDADLQVTLNIPQLLSLILSSLLKQWEFVLGFVFTTKSNRTEILRIITLKTMSTF